MEYIEMVLQPPEDMEKWLHEQGRRGREVIIYQAVRLRNPLTGEKEKVAKCHCTNCGGEWYAEITRPNGSYPMVETHQGFMNNGSIVKCPECGKTVELAYLTRLRRHPIKSTVYPWTVSKAGGCVIFACWAAQWEVDEYGEGMEIQPRNAYVVTPEGKWIRYTAMERSGWSSMSPMEYTGEWRRVERFSFADGNTKLMHPHGDDVYQGTILENAKLEIVEAKGLCTNLPSYAKLYTKYPNLENLVMTCPNITEWILWQYNESSNGPGGKLRELDWINWKAVRPHEMLGMQKDEMQRLESAGRGQINAQMHKHAFDMVCKRLNLSQKLKPTAAKIGLDKCKLMSQRWPAKAFGVKEVVRYIEKRAKAIDARGDYGVVLAIKDCEDYWRDLNRTPQADTESYSSVFPPNLNRAHARVLQAIKYAEDEKLREKFTQQAKRLQPLSWMAHGLVIRVAESEMELIEEGKALGHCVGGYGEEHCNGNSIFFIRLADSPDTPYYTLQLNTRTGKVIQNRGEKNCARTEEVKAFENEWIETVVMPWIDKRTKKRAESRIKISAA